MNTQQTLEAKLNTQQSHQFTMCETLFIVSCMGQPYDVHKLWIMGFQINHTLEIEPISPSKLITSEHTTSYLAHELDTSHFTLLCLLSLSLIYTNQYMSFNATCHRGGESDPKFPTNKKAHAHTHTRMPQCKSLS